MYPAFFSCWGETQGFNVELRKGSSPTNVTSTGGLSANCRSWRRCKKRKNEVRSRKNKQPNSKLCTLWPPYSNNRVAWSEPHYLIHP